eukprot:gene3242-2224_t
MWLWFVIILIVVLCVYACGIVIDRYLLRCFMIPEIVGLCTRHLWLLFVRLESRYDCCIQLYCCEVDCFERDEFGGWLMLVVCVMRIMCKLVFVSAGLDTVVVAVLHGFGCMNLIPVIWLAVVGLYYLQLETGLLGCALTCACGTTLIGPSDFTLVVVRMRFVMVGYTDKFMIGLNIDFSDADVFVIYFSDVGFGFSLDAIYTVI